MRVFLLLLAFCVLTQALKHDLSIKKDTRRKFFIEGFGFETGGVWEMTVKDFSINGANQEDCFFVVKKTESDPSAFSEDSEDSSFCQDSESATKFSIKNATYEHFTKAIGDGERGFYRTDFVTCSAQKAPVTVSFDLELIQKNRIAGQDCYLAAGEISYPTLYGGLFMIYIVMLLVWIFGFMCGTRKKVLGIHYLMSVLVVLKMCTLFFKAAEYHYLKTTGSPGGWAILYYIFTFLKGITLFVVVALIGTGWTFLKPYLSDREKKIFLIVIPLQLIDNIALVIIEETAPGYKGWFTWKDIFLLVDIVCCLAILLPIIWSIKHLRDASKTDGKAATNIEKLQLFRQFYLLVVSYIYFTRIIVYLLDATIAFDYKWIVKLCNELAVIVFFSITGYKFRPVTDNPFFGEEPEGPSDTEANTTNEQKKGEDEN